MSVNFDLLKELMDFAGKNPCQCTLYLNDGKFPIANVSIINSPTPVTEPTTRGGVYFSDKFAYKMKGTINDLSVVSLLTKNMLGPNTEFGELKIMTQIHSKGQIRDVEIFTNLTNSVQTPNSIELNMIIVRLEFL
ncbi:MAG: hypothetical protein ACR2LL_13580 [Nitrosopumilus sp.]